MQSKQASGAQNTHPQSGWEPPLTGQARRLFLIVLASVVMAVNIKSFVDAGGLFPGGFNGLTLLIQRSAQQFAGIALPFTAINLLLNAIPAVISFRLIGKRFTLYSCLMIALTSVLTDIIPSMPLTNDVLLVCIFGGIINGFSISLCLLGRATSGGTDFIAVALSERLNVDAWNYIFIGNCLMLVVAGMLFGWDKALYSIIFQFASTQVVHLLDPRFKRTTLFIISNRAPEIYEQIKDTTHHGATLFHGTGLYNGEERDLIYSVITSDQVKEITRAAREIDPHAFINILKTDQVAGNFYRRPHD
ncbi:YitT family protein [Agathobaculum sp. Marseille-P7918]|uniref:YitT family protein n=1 Tax=Agathobaculum sp. Marseille-P7918 TaxID=2479843 RepID=UPI0035640F9F